MKKNKKCSTCKKNPKAVHSAYCKPCKNEYMRVYRIENDRYRLQAVQNARQYRIDNAESLRAKRVAKAQQI
jgi:hypothetical protein